MNENDIDFEKYSDLINRLDKTLEDEQLKDIVPALASFLALAGFFGKIEKEALLDFFSKRLNTVYDDGIKYLVD